MSSKSWKHRTGFKARLAKTFHIRSTPRPPSSTHSKLSEQESIRLSEHVDPEDGYSVSNDSYHHHHHEKTLLDTQLGERKDNTQYFHSLVYQDGSTDEVYTPKTRRPELITPIDHITSHLPRDIWDLILDYLSPADAASLAFTSKPLRRLLGPEPWNALNRPENYQFKIDFLIPMDQYLPNHLLCFLCASYHYRTERGHETLKPALVHNPIFNCPKAFDLPFPRTRITPRRNLPFSFVQLVMRAEHYGPQYGIPLDSLARRWKEEHWSHQSRYAIIKGHLFMRVISSAFAAGGLTPSEQRLLLFSRDDYSPYFSACAHWRDGLLMDLCKCALGHIPAPRDLGGLHAVGVKIDDRLHKRVYDPNSLVTLCEECRPMRRCPECPSEYLIELKKMEDRTTNEFKRAIMVTRWCDLGDGRSPASREWAACNAEGEKYDSIKEIGRRAISGVFESHFTEDHIPGQRILSLNPKMEKHGDVDDPRWY